MKFKSKLSSFVHLSGALILTLTSAQALDGSWAADIAGSWSDDTKWTDNIIADGIGHTATFGNVITLDRVVTLDSSRIIGNIIASDTSHNYTISGANTLQLERSDSTKPTINVTTVGRTLSISSVITGDDGLLKVGAGYLTMSGVNTFTGGINLSAGRINVYNNANEQSFLGDASNVLTFTGNAELYNVDGEATLPQSVTIDDTFTGIISGAFGERTIVNGIMAGSGKLVVQGYSAGFDLELRNTGNTFTGPIEIRSGDSATLGVRSLLDSANKISLQSDGNNGGTFEYMAGAITSLELNSRQFELIVNGNSGTNFDRQATISNNAATAYIVTVNTDLLLTGTGSKNFVLRGGNVGDNTFAGIIPDAAGTNVLSFYKRDGGKWVLTGENTYQGTSTIDAGTLSIDSIGDVGGIASALGTPSTIANGKILMGSGNTTGTLLYTGPTASSDRTIQVNSINNTNTGGATIQNDGTGPLTFNAPTLNNAYVNASAVTRTLTLSGSNGGTIEGIIQDNSATNLIAVMKSGTGIWQLSGPNTYSGATTLNGGGTLVLSGSNSSAGITTIGTGGGILQLNSSINGGLASGNLNLNVDSAIVQALNEDRVITNNVILNASPTFSGDFSIAMGNVRVNNGDRTLTNNIATGETLTIASVDRDGSNNRSLTVAGTGDTLINGPIILGTGAVTMNGTGSLILSGITAYTGATNVNAGKLFINGDQTASTGTVTVAGDATLGGTGSTGGNISIADTGKLEFTISTAPGTHDGLELDAEKTLTFDATSTLTINSVSGGTTGNYILVTAPGGIIGEVPILALPSGWVANVTKEMGDTQLVLNVTAITGGDTTAPLLTSINDNVSGGPVNIGATVNYTVTFNEDMNGSTVSATDFGNNGTAATSIGTVVETTPGVFTVPVTVNSPGTLVLRINSGADLRDASNNALVTTPVLLDNNTINVRNAYQSWALTNAPTGTGANDFDADGVNNAIEFMLGGDKDTNDLSKLPVVTMTTTDMIVTFERKRSSIDGITGSEIEVSTNLTSWPISYTVGTTTANSDPGVTVTENSSSGFDTITLTVPKGTDPKKFARLSVTVTE